MRYRGLTHLTIALFVLLIAVSGCSRPVVRNGGQTPGLPGPYTAGPVAEQAIQTVQAQLRVIYFDYDNYTISPQAQGDLQFNADVLRQIPHLRVVAEGNCDERGTAEYNLALGDRRARAVIDYLVSGGLPPERFSTVSYGSELPVDPGHNEAAWAKNRRVYLRVSP